MLKTIGSTSLGSKRMIVRVVMSKETRLPHVTNPFRWRREVSRVGPDTSLALSSFYLRNPGHSFKTRMARRGEKSGVCEQTRGARPCT